MVKKRTLFTFLIFLLSVALPISAGEANIHPHALLNATLAKEVLTIVNLIQNGIDVNYQDPSKNYCALHFAIDDEFITNLLLENGALVDMQNKKKITALHFAIARNRKKSARALLEHNANPNIQDLQGNTPLHIAILKNNVQLVFLLLQYRADPFILNNNGDAAADLAQHAHPTIQAIFPKISTKSALKR